VKGRRSTAGLKRPSLGNGAVLEFRSALNEHGGSLDAGDSSKENEAGLHIHLETTVVLSATSD